MQDIQDGLYHFRCLSVFAFSTASITVAGEKYEARRLIGTISPSRDFCMMNQNSSNLSFPLKAHPGPHIPSSDRSDSPRMASQPPQQSPYVVLSIARSATAEEGKLPRFKLVFVSNNTRFQVRKAYRQKVLETHPDKLPQTATELQKELATERFHRVCDSSNWNEKYFTQVVSGPSSFRDFEQR